MPLKQNILPIPKSALKTIGTAVRPVSIKTLVRCNGDHQSMQLDRTYPVYPLCFQRAQKVSKHGTKSHHLRNELESMVAYRGYVVQPKPALQHIMCE